MSPTLWWLAAIPWIVLPLATLARAAWSRTLAEVPDEPPADAPLLSVIIPARNEARNIEACARSVLASTYPRLEVIVVDDRSEDDTGAIARRLTSEDARLRVVDAPPLPEGWFGKQWACTTGAEVARGEWLVFIDADSRHAPDLLTRSLNLARERRAELVTVAARQLLGTFWEKVIQPQIFTMLLIRYGGTEWVNRSPLVSDKIANGQFLMLSRASYDALGGHGAVREHVAEDLAIAQRWFAARRRTVIVLGLDQLSTRMYESLGEIVRGWMKNIVAGGRHSMPGGRVGRLLAPLFVLAGPFLVLAPVVALIVALLGMGPPELLRAAAIATAAQLLWWALVYRAFERLSPLWAFVFPLGGVILLYIVIRALARGSRVEWKGREYRAA